MKVLEYLNLEVRLGRFRVRRGTTAKRLNLECACPSCGRDFKFSVNVETGAFGCYSCTLRGSILSEALRDKDKWRSVRLAAGRSGVAMSAATGTGKEGISLPFCPLWPGAEAPLPPALSGTALPSLVRRGYSYCQSRGLTRDQIVRYGVSVVDLQSRVYFPYWDEHFNITYWMGRAIEDDVHPKTLEPGGQATKPLFGWHVAGAPRTGEVVPLVEGVFDHFATPRSFAVMGSFLSRDQLQSLVRLDPAWVPVLFDPDAKEKALRVASSLWQAGIKSSVVHLTGTAKDPADLGAVVMAKIVNHLRLIGPPRRLGVLHVWIAGDARTPPATMGAAG